MEVKMDARRTLLIGWAIFCLAVILGWTVALSHTEDGETVQYPSECCGSYDCAPIITLTRLPNGDAVVTTRHGTKVFPKDFPWRFFESRRTHACFNSSAPLCLLAPAGM